jgi:hypothetical protein
MGIRRSREGNCDKLHGGFCKKTLELPRCAANGVAEMELGGDSRRRKAM